MKKKALFTSFLVLCLSLVGCGSSFNVKQLGKADIDFVADSHRKAVEEGLYEMMVKLYRRHPSELQKQLEPTIDAQVNRLKASLAKGAPLLIDGREGIELLSYAFNEHYQGDRVFTLVGGLLSMVHKSYGYHTEFFIFDKLDEQKLYKSARNIEVFSWRLRTEKNSQGDLLLLSTQLNGPEINLSFEHLVAKIISMQDMMALIAADQKRRTLNSVAHGVAKAVFIPL